MSKLVLKLFVAGLSKRNSDTIAVCKMACSDILKFNPYEIKVIDILKNASMAEENKILATPTLLLMSTLGFNAEKRIIGELKDMDKAKKAIEFLTAEAINQLNNDKIKRAAKAK